MGDVIYDPIRIVNLLSSVTLIEKKYAQAIKLSGEGFNIFKILGVESREVQMHSAFIAELLRPSGSHDQGTIFLELFLQVFRIEAFDQADLGACNVSVEFTIDKINETRTEGGRIDILIQSKCNRTILIENKIYAKDQENQLQRYKAAYPEAVIVYLTLDGSAPSDFGKGSLSEDDFVLRSYTEDILIWLQHCREKAVSVPMLRECLSQYINLIQYLTNQSSNKKQNMEIQQLIMDSEEKFESAKLITKAFNGLQELVKSCEEEIFNAWLIQYKKKEVPLFQYKQYTFYVKISTEWKYLHFDLYPIVNAKLGFANDPEVAKFRVIAKQFEGRAVNNNEFFSNGNYTVWVWSKFDLRLRSVNYSQYKELGTNRYKWINQVLKEGEEFIDFMKSQLKLMNDSSIQIL